MGEGIKVPKWYTIICGHGRPRMFCVECRYSKQPRATPKQETNAYNPSLFSSHGRNLLNLRGSNEETNVFRFM